MAIKSISEINQYIGTSVNPLETPETTYELYSVPSFDIQYPEIITGAKIGSNKVTVEDGDVLICKINPRINRVWVVKHHTAHQLLASSEWIVVRNKSIDSNYLKWYFSSPTFRRLLTSQVAGIGGSLTRAQPKQVSKYPVPIPSPENQHHIAMVLDKVSNLIALRKQQLAKLDELVKARFVEMFGDKGYPEDTLLNLCNIIDYRGKTPEKVEYGLPFITAKNVRMHQMNLEPREYISKETYDKVMVRGFPKEGDVVFTTEAPLGNVCRIPHFDTEFYIGQRIVTLQTEKLEPIYLEYALSSDDFKMKYMEKSSGSTVTGIRVRLLEQLTIPVPSIELQEQFATFVEQTDKSKSAVQQALDKLETLKKALMQEYFG